MAVLFVKWVQRGSVRQQGCLRREHNLSEAHWEDFKQRKQIKPLDFYESNALKKQYFYHVNLFGNLFIEDVLPKNITSCLKSEKFLDFFYSQMQPNNLGEHTDYPLISPCGKEMNFIKPADPFGGIVLKEWNYEQKMFSYGGTKLQPLIPDSFMISKEGRLYHALTTHKHSKALGNLALVQSQIAIDLCENNVEFGETDTFFLWENKRYLMKSIETVQNCSNSEI